MGDENDSKYIELKKEVEIQSAACNICGQIHETHDCPFLVDLYHVQDTPILSKARQTLPKDLEITKMADGSTTIITKNNFQRGTTFGPFEAKRNWSMNPITNFPIRIFGNSPDETYHLDYSNEETSNWMCFIVPASCAKEQNLICYQVKLDIYYTAMRAISSGEELRVWYAPYYAIKMKMPLYDIDFANLGMILPNNILESPSSESKTVHVEILNKNIAQELAEKLPALKLGAKGEKENWICRICSTILDSVVVYAKHLMEHYKPLLGTFCNICNKKFHNISVLEKHKSTQHPEIHGKLDETIGIPTSENQQQQNAQTFLLNIGDNEEQTSEAINEIFEKFKSGKFINENSMVESEKENDSELPLIDTNSINVNDLLQNNGSLIENSSLKCILENQCLNINLSSMTDSILSDNIAVEDQQNVEEKFNVEELASELLDMAPDVENSSQSIQPLDCDICGKKFEKPEYLYRHLRKHTGEFICPSCLAVFARKENLMSHNCSSQKQNIDYECPYCQKHFSIKKYLKRHMTRHLAKDNCKWCRHVFSSEESRGTHKCVDPKHVCEQCNKRFLHRAHLNRHMKLHTDPKPVTKRVRKKNPDEKPVICEKCGDAFKSTYSLKQHLRSHGERMFECDVCHRRFHRIGVLKEHKQIHQSPQIPCTTCGKMLKSKKALDVHVLLHGSKKFHCEKCDKSFFQRCNYQKHYRQIHAEKNIFKCTHCSTKFTNETSFNKHVESHTKPAEFTCSSCEKSFHGNYQLKRHIQTSHSGIIYRCPYCDMSARHRHSMRRHFERRHKNITEEWDRPGFVSKLIEIPSAEEKESGEKSDNAEIQISNSAVGEIFPSTSNIQDDNQTTTLNGQQVLLQMSEVDQTITGTTDLSLNDVPQLSISDADTLLAEAVLGNAYIVDENGGNIMFYVLDNAPVIAEY